jgi:hypothetical protein
MQKNLVPHRFEVLLGLPSFSRIPGMESTEKPASFDSREETEDQAKTIPPNEAIFNEIFNKVLDDKSFRKLSGEKGLMEEYLEDLKARFNDNVEGASTIEPQNLRSFLTTTVSNQSKNKEKFSGAIAPPSSKSSLNRTLRYRTNFDRSPKGSSSRRVLKIL